MVLPTQASAFNVLCNVSSVEKVELEVVLVEEAKPVNPSVTQKKRRVGIVAEHSPRLM